MNTVGNITKTYFTYMSHYLTLRTMANIYLTVICFFCTRLFGNGSDQLCISINCEPTLGRCINFDFCLFLLSFVFILYYCCMINTNLSKPFSQSNLKTVCVLMMAMLIIVYCCISLLFIWCYIYIFLSH